jgi:hypothetical protein
MITQMSNCIYIFKCLDGLEKRFRNQAEDSMRSNSMRYKNTDEKAKPINEAANLIFGQETELPPELPAAETPTSVVTPDLKYLKTIDIKFTTLTINSVFTFSTILGSLDNEIETQPQKYKSGTGGVHLHKILRFFDTFLKIYKDMIKKKNETNCNWNELLANHFLANFSLATTEDHRTIF